MRTMYDSIESTVLDLPDGADVYMGYDDGNWPDAAAIAARFPNKLVLRATTNPMHNEGQVLDLERGNATPAGITGPGWVARRRAAGLAAPIVYVQLSNWGTAWKAFISAEVAAPLWFIANWNLDPTIPAAAVGHQYATRGTYDVSVIVDYLPGIDPVPPTTEEELAMRWGIQTYENGLWAIIPGPTGLRRAHVATPQDATALEAMGAVGVNFTTTVVAAMPVATLEQGV